MKLYRMMLTLFFISSSAYAGGDLFTNYGRYAARDSLNKTLRTEYNLTPETIKRYFEFLNASANANVKILKRWYDHIQQEETSIPVNVISTAHSLAEKSYRSTTMQALALVEKIAQFTSK